jgi:hypothetical protein
MVISDLQIKEKHHSSPVIHSCWMKEKETTFLSFFTRLSNISQAKK